MFFCEYTVILAATPPILARSVAGIASC